MWDLQEGDPKKIGSFRLVARLGSGGMGTVYLAAQEERDGHVAVKTIRSDYAQEEGFRRRFTREATAASSVRSPYTVRVIGFDVQACEPWLATEYVEGLSLRDHVQSHGPLTLSATVELALGLSFGLASIHRAGLVHRDLKPGNVLLTEAGPKIIDFGLAYATDFSHATHTGAVVGTPGYFSPEQVQGHSISPASDIFALGAVLAFASSGDHAFRGATALTAQYHVVHEEPWLSDVPEELRDLIAGCMHKNPRERPPLNVILAHLTSLRSYGHKKTGSVFRRAPSHPAETDPGAGSPTVLPLATRSRWGRRVALSVSGVALVAVGAVIGPWLVPGHEGEAGAGPHAPIDSVTVSAAPGAGPSAEEATSEPPITEPASDPADESAPLSDYEEFRLGILTFSPVLGKCVLDGDGMTGDGMPVGNPGNGYSVSVTPISFRDRFVSRAVIKVRASRAQLPDEPVTVYLKLPKGETVPLNMPEDKAEWSFRWPDVLKTADLSSPFATREPATLLGAYTILIAHGAVQACGGFDGDPKGYAEATP